MPQMRDERITWIEDRMRAAGRLVLAATNELIEAPPQALFDFANIELVTRATSSAIREFVARLVEVRPSREPAHCPHCGFSRRYRKLDRCPRCGGLRGVSRASALGDPVRFARELRGRTEGSQTLVVDPRHLPRL
jgi:hypothetical protein